MTLLGGNVQCADPVSMAVVAFHDLYECLQFEIITLSHLILLLFQAAVWNRHERFNIGEGKKLNLCFAMLLWIVRRVQTSLTGWTM